MSMHHGLQRIGLQFTACKCCGTPSPLFGVVDFNKNCEAIRGRDPLELSGVPVYYHRCPKCQLIFTIAFDKFTPEDFQKYIYDEEYALIDPDFAEARPRSYAQFLNHLFSRTREVPIVEYGGGNGNLSQLLRDYGYRNVHTYDPAVPKFAKKPECHYDCVLCLEVLEHNPDPKSVMADVHSLMAEEGLIIFSTLLQPDDIEQQGIRWWYLAPRNGHCCMFTRQSLQEIIHPYGLQLQSFNEGLHVLYRDVPDFASHLFMEET
jgi:hypothetical protein